VLCFRNFSAPCRASWRPKPEKTLRFLLIRDPLYPLGRLIRIEPSSKDAYVRAPQTRAGGRGGAVQGQSTWQHDQNDHLAPCGAAASRPRAHATLQPSSSGTSQERDEARRDGGDGRREAPAAPAPTEGRRRHRTRLDESLEPRRGARGARGRRGSSAHGRPNEHGRLCLFRETASAHCGSWRPLRDPEAAWWRLRALAAPLSRCWRC